MRGLSRHCRAQGFTLAEMAIAVVILALLLASAFLPISTQMELKTIADTQRSLDQIREAIIGFTLANGRLPCPATGTTASSNSGAGQESRSGGPTYYYCSSARGVVPWATLGVPEADSWGRRFSYRVAPVFADDITCATSAVGDWGSRASGATNCPAPPAPASAANQTISCSPSPLPTQSSIALCTLGDLSVYTRADSNHGASAYAQQVAAVVVSHGKNGYGGYAAGTGSTLSSPAASTDEATNANGGATVITSAGANLSTSPLTYIFISRPQSAVASGCTDGSTGTFCEFDDIVAWIPTTVLVSRLVTAGKLP
jgi:prepilin-type N-terminal cleavage/methylation domain-containing protein